MLTLVTVCSLKAQFGKLVLFTDVLCGWCTRPCLCLSPQDEWVLAQERSLVPCSRAEACVQPWTWDPFLVLDIELSSFTPSVGCAPLPVHRVAGLSWKRSSRWGCPDAALCRGPQQSAQDKALWPSGLTFMETSRLCRLPIFSSDLLGFHSQPVLTSAVASL